MRVPLTALTLLLVVAVPSAFAVGEPVGTFPRWEERVVHQLTNRARANPAAELAGCNSTGTNCTAAELNASCYTPIAPLAWNLDLNEASRFHSAHMLKSAYFAHDSNCALFTDIDALYPETCDASAACSCAGAGTTSTATRVTRFGATFTGEIIAAGYPTPNDVFYGWLYEAAPTGTGCVNNSVGSQTNGHRFIILKNTGPGIGYGYEFDVNSPAGFDHYWTGNFGTPGVLTKIPSGSHWGSTNHLKQQDSVEFWANWFDAAGPTQANVVIDGVARPLTLARGTATNGAWTATVTGLGTGCHTYYFSFRDSANNLQEYPTTGSFGIGNNTCPDWTPTRAVATAKKGDFNRDGQSDIVWRNYSSGLDLFWTMNGTTRTGVIFLPDITDLNWRLEASGDFNGDGYQDLAWRNYSSGLNVMWFLNGTSFDQWSFFPDVADLNWHIQGAGDFNNDGRADIVWRNYATGQNSVWYMNRAVLLDGVFLPSVADLNWQIGAVNDFNNDNRPDLVWRNYFNGQNLIWFMNNTSITLQSSFPGVADTNWKIQGTGDFTNDNKADIVWRNLATGENSVWQMDGATLVNGLFLEGVGDLNWHIAGAR